MDSSPAEHKSSRFEEVMTRVSEVVETRLAPPLLRMGNQRHFVAIRAGLIRIIPIIIVGSIPLILANLPIAALAEAMAPFNSALMSLFAMTFGFMTLVLSISIGAELARMYKLETTIVSIITAICFLITAAPIDLETGTISTANLGASGMFTAFVVAIIVVETMRFMRDRGITIRMPAGVPENIGASFSALIPMFVLFTFFWLLRVVFGFNLVDVLARIVSPLLIASDTFLGVLVAGLVLCLLWFVGIHGGSLTVWGVLYPFMLANIAANAEAVSAGLTPTRAFVEPFIFIYGMPSGVGITMPLIIYWWRSRSVRLREVARVALGPGIFNINEPVNFGAPIILNPLMFVPFVFLTTTFGMLFGFVLIKIGWVTAPYIQTPWTTPMFFNAYLSTGGDWRSVIAQIVLLGIVALVWFPFAKVWERRLVKEEAGLLEVDSVTEAGKAFAD
jgi:cellobiose PTS system EIIC component